jgi:hypothetical protein
MNKASAQLVSACDTEHHVATAIHLPLYLQVQNLLSGVLNCTPLFGLSDLGELEDH